MAYVETCVCGLFRGERVLGDCPDATVPICTDRRSAAMTTTDPPAPSDEKLREEAACLFLCSTRAPLVTSYLAGHHSRDAEVNALRSAPDELTAAHMAGFHSRDAEVEALRAERDKERQLHDEACELVVGQRAERDKLHRAMAWREEHHMLVRSSASFWLLSVAPEFANESHDGTPAGRAAALVRLWDRITPALPEK